MFQTLLLLLCAHFGPSLAQNSGNVATQGQFKYMAYVLHSPTRNTSHFVSCSATIIGVDWVLLSARCLGPDARLVKPENVIVVAGKADLTEYLYWRTTQPFDSQAGTELQVQERRLTNIFVHPKYNTNSKDNDLVLMKIRSLDMTLGNARFIRIALTKLDDKVCEVPGWTPVYPGLLFLNNVEATAVSQQKCPMKDGELLCLVGKQYNLGGPLVCDGMVWGVSYDQGSATAVGDVYFTELWPHLDWINKQMECEGDCKGAAVTSLAVYPLCLALALLSLVL